MLDGKVLIPLRAGTPQDVRDAEAWAPAQGADDLDGAILARPNQIGRPDTPICLSGSNAAFRTSEPALSRLAGNLTFTGEAVGSASAWDLATPSCMIGAMFAGARICESEGLRAGSFGAMIADIAPVPGEMIKRDGEDSRAEAYDQPLSSMKTCAVVGELSVSQTQEARINTALPSCAAGPFNQAMAAGDRNERSVSLTKVLREDMGPS